MSRYSVPGIVLGPGDTGVTDYFEGERETVLDVFDFSKETRGHLLSQVCAGWF